MSPGGCLVPRGPQGPRAGAHDPAGAVLASDAFFPFRGRGGRGGRGRRRRDHPAGRLGARRRGDRRGGRARPGDGIHRGPAVPTLTRRPRHDRSLEPSVRPYSGRGCVALGVLLLYIVTLAPTTQFWDTSEYIAAAHVLGIPHPPGNPLFALLAHVWGMLPLRGRLRARASTCSRRRPARSRPACWFLIGERWLRPIVPAPLAAPARGAGRRARRRDGVHGVEPVGREREGVHGEPAVDRADAVAHRALGRPGAGRGARSPSAAHHVPAGAHLHEPHDGRAGGTGGGGAAVPAARCRAARRAKRAAPWSGRSGSRSWRCSPCSSGPGWRRPGT